LAEVGITTIGALAETPPDTLEMLFGRFGPELGERARGIDDRPISLEHEVKSISNETTFARDLTDEVALREAFRRLADQVGRRLRKASLAGTTIQVKLRWADFTTITRQTTLPFPTNLDREIYDTALQLFMENWTRGRPVRLIGVGVSHLGPPARQLGLWDDTPQKEASLLTAVDKLRERYGRDIIQRANRVRKNRQGHDDNEVSDQK
jgi:DNA polymerase-4